MRFLADENFPRTAVLALRAAGAEVDSLTDIAPGATDAAVLARALIDGSVILTFDKDFADWARRSTPTPGFGVVLFRLPVPKGAEAGEALARSLCLREDWAGHFSVIEPGRLRMRDLVAPKPD